MAQKIYYVAGKKHYEITVSRRDREGKRVRKKARLDQYGRPIVSKRIADRVEYILRNKLNDKIKRSSTLTWEKWHEKFIEKIRMQFLESTVITYEGGLRKWSPTRWREKELYKFTRDDVYDLIFNEIGNREDASKNIQRSVLKRIRRIFEMAVEENLLPKNPSLGISVKVPPPKQKVLNSNEATLLLKTAKECNHRFYYHWALALLTGMRNGELYSLRWADIDLDTGLISVTKQWTSKDGLHPTKSNRNRVIPISKDLRGVLTELKVMGPFEERLWPGLKITRKYPVGDPRRKGPHFDDLVLPRLKEWRYGEQAKYLKAFCGQLGIEEVEFHDLRATLITNLLAQGVSLPKVMNIVGHSELSTTNEYLRLSGVDVKKDTVDKLGYRTHDGEKKIVNLFG
ncbi:MAG: site-specific integrase [Bacteriovoracales bacterium]|nr:site-specific integrase [Bacteriovoracales bacterium]